MHPWKIMPIALVCVVMLGGCKKRQPPPPEDQPAVEAVAEDEVAPQPEPEPAVKPEPEPAVEPAVVPAPEPAVEPAPEPTIAPATEPAVEGEVEPAVEGEPEPTTTPAIRPVAPNAVVVEIESFELANCTVKDLPEASGKKAVLFADYASRATKLITLAKGRYDVTVYIQAEDGSQDAFLLTVGESKDNRVFPDGWGALHPTETLRILQAADGPCEVIIQTAEKDFLLDRIIFEPVEIIDQ